MIIFFVFLCNQTVNIHLALLLFHLYISDIVLLRFESLLELTTKLVVEKTNTQPKLTQTSPCTLLLQKPHFFSFRFLFSSSPFFF
eukprot:m.81232 g.81232  ORF g.81232 m.81232 type:complete len:85 (-) comp14240_c0_seq1:53-307(-)